MVKLNRIYTRTGDGGTTGLVDGSRVGKDDPRIAAIGAVDEANSAIGWAAALLKQPGPGSGDPMGWLAVLLERIQNDLFDLGADLATPTQAPEGDAEGEDFAPSEMVLRVVPQQVARLEDEIDRMNADLSPLGSFILPGGTPAAAALHVARAGVRHAERQAIAAGRTVPVNPQAIAYLNRLSDHLFVAARAVNHIAVGDVLWRPGAAR